MLRIGSDGFTFSLLATVNKSPAQNICVYQFPCLGKAIFFLYGDYLS